MLEEFLERPDIKPIIAKDLFVVTIDRDRMENGKYVAQKLRKSERGGIPWFVITDAALERLVTSDDVDGKNCGFPVKQSEIDHFCSMLDKVRKKMTRQDVATIRQALEKNAERIYARRAKLRKEREQRKK